MFKKFMDLAKINKIIAKQRKLALTDPDTGYSAIITAMLEQEAKGTFKNMPEYSRKVVNEFFVESINNMRKTTLWQNACAVDNTDPATTDECSIIYCALMMQAIICKDLEANEAIEHVRSGSDNACKVLVNMNLLHERWLDDEPEIRVA